MKRVKWFVTAVAMGTLLFGCKAKEQTAETPPPEQPKAAATAAPKAEPPAAVAAQPEATASAPAPAPRSGYDRALLRAALLKDKAPDTFQVKFTTTRGDRKSTRLNSSHGYISYAVFCLKKKKKKL